MNHLAITCSILLTSASYATGPVYMCDFDWATTGNGGCDSGQWGRFVDASGSQIAYLQPEGASNGCSIVCYPSYCFGDQIGCFGLQTNCYAVTALSGGVQIFASTPCRRLNGRFFAPPSSAAPSGELLFVFRTSISGSEITRHTVPCYAGAPHFVDVNIDVPEGFGYVQVVGLHWLADDLLLEAQTPPPPCPADLFVDGQVNGADLGILLTQWGQGGNAVADLSHDGYVNGADLGILLSSWGACP